MIKNEEGMVKIGDLVVSEDIVTEVAAYLNKDRSRKIKEGMLRNGKRYGRPALPDEVVMEIKKLRGKGLSYKIISELLSEKGLKVSIKTINKYCLKHK